MGFESGEKQRPDCALEGHSTRAYSGRSVWASNVAKNSVQTTLWRNIPLERNLDATFRHFRSPALAPKRASRIRSGGYSSREKSARCFSPLSKHTFAHTFAHTHTHTQVQLQYCGGTLRSFFCCLKHLLFFVFY